MSNQQRPRIALLALFQVCFVSADLDLRGQKVVGPLAKTTGLIAAVQHRQTGNHFSFSRLFLWSARLRGIEGFIIAPRPLMLIHAAKDSVTPTEQSIEMFKRAGQPSELHLFSGLDHFLFAEKSTRVWNLLRQWLDTHFRPA